MNETERINTPNDNDDDDKLCMRDLVLSAWRDTHQPIPCPPYPSSFVAVSTAWNMNETERINAPGHKEVNESLLRIIKAERKIDAFLTTKYSEEEFQSTCPLV